MAAAYRYASRPNAPAPPEVEAARLLARFGPAAVYGRPMYYGEMLRVETAEKIVRGYAARESAVLRGEASMWVAQNLEINQLLTTAEVLANGRS